MTSRGLGLADRERENALLVGIIEAISAGPELGQLAAKVVPLIVAGELFASISRRGSR